MPAAWLLVAQLSPALCPLQGTIPIVGAQDREMLVRKDKSLATSTAHWQNLPFSLPPS